jgi:hypothetical protein
LLILVSSLASPAIAAVMGSDSIVAIWGHWTLVVNALPDMGRSGAADRRPPIRFSASALQRRWLSGADDDGGLAFQDP